MKYSIYISHNYFELVLCRDKITLTKFNLNSNFMVNQNFHSYCTLLSLQYLINVYLNKCQFPNVWVDL